MFKQAKKCPVCGDMDARYERTLREIDLARCLECGFVFTNLSDKKVLFENSKFDAGDIEHYRTIQSYLDRLWFQFIAKRMTKMAGPGKSPKSVLDVGCGNGLLLSQFKELGWKIYGCDLSAWSRKPANEIGFFLYNKPIEEMTNSKSKFQVVTSTSTLEHIPNLVDHMKSVLRLLAPGGFAYFSGMPNYGSLAVRLRVSAFYHNLPPRHANWFTPVTLRKLWDHKSLKKDVANVIVNSYGIPEIHRLYGFLHRKKAGAKGTQTGDHKQRAKPLSVRKKTFGEASFLANYWAGRVMVGMGDKLELVVQKTA